MKKVECFWEYNRIAIFGITICGDDYSEDLTLGEAKELVKQLEAIKRYEDLEAAVKELP
jgi:hypothetical protein